MPKYAFFDVDQTIYPGYSMADFYHAPAIRPYLNSKIDQEEQLIQTLYQSGQITYAEAGRRAAILCATSVQGLSVDVVAGLARNFASTSPVKPFVSPLFSLLHQSGYTIILVSGSLNFIIRAIAKHTGADRYHATTPELDSKKTYTGNITHQLDDIEKENIIKQNYDLAHATVLAFGDSTGDIPMLSLAHHAFVINPHQEELLALAQKEPKYHLVTEANLLATVSQVI